MSLKAQGLCPQMVCAAFMLTFVFPGLELLILIRREVNFPILIICVDISHRDAGVKSIKKPLKQENLLRKAQYSQNHKVIRFTSPKTKVLFLINLTNLNLTATL